LVFATIVEAAQNSDPELFRRPLIEDIPYLVVVLPRTGRQALAVFTGPIGPLTRFPPLMNYISKMKINYSLAMEPSVV
jgi:hypothetical protein